MNQQNSMSEEKFRSLVDNIVAGVATEHLVKALGNSSVEEILDSFSSIQYEEGKTPQESYFLLQETNEEPTRHAARLFTQRAAANLQAAMLSREPDNEALQKAFIETTLGNAKISSAIKVHFTPGGKVIDLSCIEGTKGYDTLKDVKPKYLVLSTNEEMIVAYGNDQEALMKHTQDSNQELYSVDRYENYYLLVEGNLKKRIAENDPFYSTLRHALETKQNLEKEQEAELKEKSEEIKRQRKEYDENAETMINNLAKEFQPAKESAQKNKQSNVNNKKSQSPANEFFVHDSPTSNGYPLVAASMQLSEEKQGELCKAYVVTHDPKSAPKPVWISTEELSQSLGPKGLEHAQAHELPFTLKSEKKKLKIRDDSICVKAEDGTLSPLTSGKIPEGRIKSVERDLDASLTYFSVEGFPAVYARRTPAKMEEDLQQEAFFKISDVQRRDAELRSMAQQEDAAEELAAKENPEKHAFSKVILPRAPEGIRLEHSTDGGNSWKPIKPGDVFRAWMEPLQPNSDLIAMRFATFSEDKTGISHRFRRSEMLACGVPPEWIEHAQAHGKPFELGRLEKSGRFYINDPNTCIVKDGKLEACSKNTKIYRGTMEKISIDKNIIHLTIELPTRGSNPQESHRTHQQFVNDAGCNALPRLLGKHVQFAEENGTLLYVQEVQRDPQHANAITH